MYFINLIKTQKTLAFFTTLPQQALTGLFPPLMNLWADHGFPLLFQVNVNTLRHLKVYLSSVSGLQSFIQYGATPCPLNKPRLTYVPICFLLFFSYSSSSTVLHCFVSESRIEMAVGRVVRSMKACLYCYS